VRSLNQAGSAQPQFEAGLYGVGWDRLVRYNYLDGGYLPHIDVTEPLVDFAYLSASRYLYLLATNGDLSRVSLAADGSVVSTVELGNVALDANPVQALKVLNNYLLVQAFDSLGAVHSLAVYEDNNGELELKTTTPITDVVFDIRDGYFDAVANRLYALGISPVTGFPDIGYLDFNPTSGLFVQVSPEFTGRNIGPVRGPIVKVKALDDQHILTGSGHRFNRDLSDPALPDWLIRIGGRTFSSFRHYLAHAEHEAIVVDFPLSTSVNGPGSDRISNGLMVVGEEMDTDMCPNSQNKYVNPEHNPENKILALLQTSAVNAGDETFAVIRTTDVIEITPLGLTNGGDDADGMSSIYEKYFDLNPSDALDRFADPDGDTLSNIEEFQCATDPKHQDSDLDGMYDDTEILNGTSPTDPDDL